MLEGKEPETLVPPCGAAGALILVGGATRCEEAGVVCDGGCGPFTLSLTPPPTLPPPAALRGAVLGKGFSFDCGALLREPLLACAFALSLSELSLR